MKCNECEWCKSRKLPIFNDEEDEAEFWARHDPEQFDLPVYRLRISPTAGARKGQPPPASAETAQMVGRLTEFIWDDSEPQTDDEILAELRNEGLNPTALVERVRQFVTARKDASRLAWMGVGAENQRKAAEIRSLREKKVNEMSRDQLLAHPALVAANFLRLQIPVTSLPIEELQQLVIDYESNQPTD